MTRRRWTVVLGAAVLGLIVATSLLLVAIGRQPHATERSILGGTDVMERDLSPEEQVRLINTYAPVPVPASATDIRLRFQRFQDIFFEGSFALPPAEYDAYVAQLKPLAPTVGVTPGSAYAGVVVGNYISVVVPDPSTHRITITYVAG